MSAVSREARHLRNHPCPICGGFDEAERGQGKRCAGYTNDEAGYAHCSRTELAGDIAINKASLYAHRLEGPCRCGVQHGDSRTETRSMFPFKLGDIQITHGYNYCDESGKLLYQVLRGVDAKGQKTFRQRRPDESKESGWDWKLGNVRKVPYRLPQLLALRQPTSIYIVEGEKDADALWAKGFVATTTSGGTGMGWDAGGISALRVACNGHTPVIVADADESGRKHARRTASMLGSNPELYEPSAPYKDVAEMFAAGVAMSLVPLQDSPAGDLAGVEARHEAGDPPPASGDRRGDSTFDVGPVVAYKVWLPPEIWAPIEPTAYAIGTLAAGDIGMVNAHGSSLKSWICIQAVIAKASGKPWLEKFETTKSPALYLDNEMGSDECRRRMQRSALSMGLDGPVDGVSLVSMPGFSLGTPAGMAEVERLAKGKSLVAVDSLAAFAGNVDENDARFADPLKRMKEIAIRTGCAFLVLHHSRKAREGEDKREAPRGTSALFNACDAVWQLSRAGEEGFMMSQTKARHGKMMTAQMVKLDDVPGVDATRVWATELVEALDEEAIISATSSIARAKRAVLLVLAQERDLGTVAQMCSRMAKGIRKQSVYAAVKELTEKGLMLLHEGSFRLASEVENV